MNVENLDPTDPPAKFDGAGARSLVDNLQGARTSWPSRRSRTTTAPPTARQPGRARDLRRVHRGDPGGRRAALRLPPDRPGRATRTAASRAATSASASCSAPTAGCRSSTGRAATRRPTDGRRDTPRGAQLSFSPGRIDPTNPAFTNSRKPLAGEFCGRARRCSSIANHFNSKGGDDPLFGRFQPPDRVTEAQRHQQATVVADFVARRPRAPTRDANVVVLGDLNDFEFSRDARDPRGRRAART